MTKKYIDIIVKHLAMLARQDADIDLQRILYHYGFITKESQIEFVHDALEYLSDNASGLINDFASQPKAIREENARNIKQLNDDVLPLLDGIITRFCPQFHAIYQCIVDLSDRSKQYTDLFNASARQLDLNTQETIEEAASDLSSFKEELTDNDEGTLSSIQSSISNISSILSNYVSSIKSTLDSVLSGQTTKLENEIDKLILMAKKYAYVYIKLLVKEAIDGLKGIDDSTIDSAFV